MFDTYEEIFTQRANSYHEAMRAFPLARRQEFELAVEYLDIIPNSVICDVPSGGGYLRPYVSNDNCYFHFLETCKSFANYSPSFENCDTQLCQFESLPLKSHSVDRLITLAALHHIQNRIQVFQEFQRVLKTNGKIVIADVESGTNIASFLNVFVNKYNSMGHVGDFIDEQTLESFEETSLKVISINRPELRWHFEDEISMITFFRNLFGLDKATDTDIYKGIQHYLSPRLCGDKISVDWQLLYVVLQGEDDLANNVIIKK